MLFLLIRIRAVVPLSASFDSTSQPAQPAVAVTVYSPAARSVISRDNYRYDPTLPGYPSSAVYTGTNSCGSSSGKTTVLIGLSIGWE